MNALHFNISQAQHYDNARLWPQDFFAAKICFLFSFYRRKTILTNFNLIEADIRHISIHFRLFFMRYVIYTICPASAGPVSITKQEG